jgi:nitroreductase
MQTWDAIRARRNVRQYTGQPIAREDLERICEAGRRAPSAGNGQPWDFVVVTDRAQLIELAKVWDRVAGTSPSRRRRSPWWPGSRRTSASAASCCMTSARPPRT